MNLESFGMSSSEANDEKIFAEGLEYGLVLKGSDFCLKGCYSKSSDANFVDCGHGKATFDKR